MKIGVLGTGTVGQTISSKLAELGHEVKMGSRSAKHEGATEWAKEHGDKASNGTFADAAAFGELVFNCTSGEGALAALSAAGDKNLDGKILIDLSNPLDFSKGMPPSLFAGNTDSLGENIQKKFPGAKVVKTLNTINANVMVDPARVGGGDHDLFMSGNDAEAKATVGKFLMEQFGWKNVIDLGDITTARGTESYLPLWLRLMGALGSADFNVKIVR